MRKSALIPLAAVASISGCLGPLYGSVATVAADLAGIICSLYWGVVGGAGFLATFIIIYAGLQWIWSKGEPQVQKKARDTVEAVLIGLVIIIAANIIVTNITGIGC